MCIQNEKIRRQNKSLPKFNRLNIVGLSLKLTFSFNYAEFICKLRFDCSICIYVSSLLAKKSPEKVKCLWLWILCLCVCVYVNEMHLSPQIRIIAFNCRSDDTNRPLTPNYTLTKRATTLFSFFIHCSPIFLLFEFIVSQFLNKALRFVDVQFINGRENYRQPILTTMCVCVWMWMCIFFCHCICTFSIHNKTGE